MEQAEGARAPGSNQGSVVSPEQLWKLCTAGCKPQVSCRPALSLHIHTAVQVILSSGSLRTTQVSGYF